jgi:hypothetical protein
VLEATGAEVPATPVETTGVVVEEPQVVTPHVPDVDTPPAGHVEEAPVDDGGVWDADPAESAEDLPAEDGMEEIRE